MSSETESSSDTATEPDTAAVDTDDESSNDKNVSISCSLGGLEVDVEGPDVESTEALFERVWTQRLDEAEDMSEAMRERLIMGHH